MKILFDKKYLKNFNKHRVSNFLINKVKFNDKYIFFNFINIKNFKFNNDDKFLLDFLENEHKKTAKNSVSPLKDSFEDTIDFLKSLNKDKFNDFKNSINLLNKSNHLFWIKLLSFFFRYSYLFRFTFEIFFFLSLLIYLFKTGTFF